MVSVRVARVRWLAVAAVAVSFATGGCGSGKSVTTTTLGAGAAKAEIARAYGTLFDFTSGTVADKLAVIEDGSSLRSALTQALSSSLAKNATGAKVHSVMLLSAGACREGGVTHPCAKVSYDLLGPKGTPLFSTPSTGYAVAPRGRWLVAKSTICSLLSLFYSASGRSGSPPGC